MRFIKFGVEKTFYWVSKFYSSKLISILDFLIKSDKSYSDLDLSNGLL